jgi:transposase InsO family protein
MADHMRSDLVADALQMAVARREPEAGLIHHGALTALAAEQTQMAPPAWASRAPRRIVSAVEAAPLAPLSSSVWPRRGRILSAHRLTLGK